MAEGRMIEQGKIEIAQNNVTVKQIDEHQKIIDENIDENATNDRWTGL